MILNKKFLYALEAVLDIALNSRGNPIQSHDITKRQGVPKRYLEAILQELVHQNILKGTRGPKGGYNLAREKRNITLNEIYKTVLVIEKKDIEINENSLLRTKIITPLMSEITDQIINNLKSKNLEDLYQKIMKNSLQLKKRKKIDFSI